MSLIGRRVVFTKAQSKGFDLIEGSFMNEEPKTIRIMANTFYNFNVDFDYQEVKYIPPLGAELRAEFVYDSTLDRDNNPLLLVTKVEHKANGLVCVYVEPVND